MMSVVVNHHHPLVTTHSLVLAALERPAKTPAEVIGLGARHQLISRCSATTRSTSAKAVVRMDPDALATAGSTAPGKSLADAYGAVRMAKVWRNAASRAD